MITFWWIFLYIPTYVYRYINPLPTQHKSFNTNKIYTLKFFCELECCLSWFFHSIGETEPRDELEISPHISEESSPQDAHTQSQEEHQQDAKAPQEQRKAAAASSPPSPPSSTKNDTECTNANESHKPVPETKNSELNIPDLIKSDDNAGTNVFYNSLLIQLWYIVYWIVLYQRKCMSYAPEHILASLLITIVFLCIGIRNRHF